MNEHTPLTILSTPAPPPRRLGLHHFAFYRAYLEGGGVDLTELADRYLAIGRDPRRVRNTIRWLQDELTAAARRQGDRGAARLLRLPRHALDAPAAPAVPAGMPLEEFRQLRDPDGVFGEAELLELYEEEIGTGVAGAGALPADRRAARAQRLRRRRLDALQQLEKAVAESPAPQHDVAGWIEPAIAARLAKVGVTTLGQLVAVVNARGYRWYVPVPRLGEQAARRVVTWLQANAATLGRGVTVRAAAPLRSLSSQQLLQERAQLANSQLAPLEAMRLPADLDGRAGTNRAPAERNQTGAVNDLAAIHAWLATHRPEGSHTWRGYRTQAERLLLWAVFKKHKPLSSLHVQDITEYLQFLIAPDADWIGPRTAARWSPEWRPFAGPLKPSSRATARMILNALFSWLVDMRYLDFNPFTGSKMTGEEAESRHIRPGRSLSTAQWNFMVDYVLSLPADLAGARARFMLLLAYGTGMRRAEMADVLLDALVPFEVDTEIGTVWVLSVIGKGGRRREIPIPRITMLALQAYLKQRGLPTDPQQCPVGMPLIAALVGAGLRPIKAPAVGQTFKQLFADAAKRLEKQDELAAGRLRRASAHWMRHTHGTHMIRAGVPLDITQDNLGHASLDTTTIYNSSDLERRIRAIEGFMQTDRS